ncbi:MAG: type II toxin-antitoxin system HicA family toxin [Gemmatimonadota bacterium]
MTGLPVISGCELAKALARIGYELDRQRGSHMVLRQVVPPFRRVTVPDHHEIAKGTLRAILKQTGLTARELAKLL